MAIVILEEAAIAHEPSEDEMRLYATYLGIDFDKEPHLKWIAREGLTAPVPHPWRACVTNDVDVFYFNFETGESVWDHPCDHNYRNMVEECRAKHLSQWLYVASASFATAATAPTEKATSATKASLIKRSGLHRFLPSRAMKIELNETWCFPIMTDEKLVAEIQSIVEANYGLCPRLCLPTLFPDFPDMLLKCVRATQKEIDHAWLDAAIDLLGRPAVRPTSTIPAGLIMFDDDMGDLYGMAQDDNQPMSATRFDYQEAMQEIAPFDGGWYHLGGGNPRSISPFSDFESSQGSTQVDNRRLFDDWSDDRATITQPSSIDFDSFDREVSSESFWFPRRHRRRA